MLVTDFQRPLMPFISDPLDQRSDHLGQKGVLSDGDRAFVQNSFQIGRIEPGNGVAGAFHQLGGIARGGRRRPKMR